MKNVAWLASWKAGPLLLVTYCALAAACVVPGAQDRKFPAYDRAVTLPPAGKTIYLYGEETDMSLFPSLIPYLAMSDTYGTWGGDKGYAARAIARRADKELKPDVIIFWNGGSQYAGSVGVASAVPTGGGAFATMFSTPTYVSSLIGVCYRLAPAQAGVHWDESGMIVLVSEAARLSGILEGDRIVSIAGAPVALGNRWPESPHYSKLMGMRPGDEVSLVWIRPGTGRMDGKLKLQDNPPTHLQLPSALELPPPRPPDTTDP